MKGRMKGLLRPIDEMAIAKVRDELAYVRKRADRDNIVWERRDGRLYRLVVNDKGLQLLEKAAAALERVSVAVESGAMFEEESE